MQTLMHLVHSPSILIKGNKMVKRFVTGHDTAVQINPAIHMLPHVREQTFITVGWNIHLDILILNTIKGHGLWVLVNLFD